MNLTEIKANLDKEIVRNVAAINTLLDDREQLRNVLTKLDQDLNNLRISQERLEYIRVNFPAEERRSSYENKTQKNPSSVNKMERLRESRNEKAKSEDFSSDYIRDFMDVIYDLINESL